MSARYAFAAHPEALADLREVPAYIRDLALLELQHLVHGHERGAPLKGRLAGCHKVYVDPEAEWRLVIQFRDAPASSRHRREIYLVAVGERNAGAVYGVAHQRMERAASGVSTVGTTASHRVQAARSRSPHLRSVPDVPPLSAPRASSVPSSALVPRKARA